jgi:hypothetical protein
MRIDMELKIDAASTILVAAVASSLDDNAAADSGAGW